MLKGQIIFFFGTTFAKRETLTIFNPLKTRQMKQLFTLFAGITLSIAAQAQAAQAVVFAEGGEKFTLILNGEKQNDAPAVNVKAKNLTNEFYQARIDFEEATLPDFSNNNFMVKQGMESTYVVKKNKKGEYVLRWASEAPISNATAATPNTSATDQVKNYAIADDEHAAPTGSTTTVTGGTTGGNVTMNTNVGASGMGVNQSVTVTETTKTTTSKPASTGTTGGNVTMNVGVPGVNMGINMTVTDATMDVEESHTSTTVTTTTTTTTTAQPKPAPAPQPIVQPARPAVREEVVVTQAPAGGCIRQMDATSFTNAKKSISDKGFDDTRLTIAKQVTKANCLTCAQIVEICNVFAFEESKLEYAKFAYDHCFDPNNYYMVNDVFSFESSMEELTKYVESK